MTNRILHCAAVDVVICHQHPFYRQDLLVSRHQESCLVGQWLSTFEPLVRGPSSIFVGAVEHDIFAELQH